MQILDGTVVLSATDLVGHTACGHLASLEREVLAGRRARPLRRDPVLDVLSRRGHEREARFLEKQHAEGRRVVELRTDRVRSLAEARAAAAATREAMTTGADVLYQATLFDGRWFGRADFLVRVEEPSALGPWSYEVADAKLSREVKGGAVLQLCLYSELLALLQGKVPASLHVLTGDGTAHAYRLDDFAAYYRKVKRRVEDRLAEPEETYPEPVEHCRVCCWWKECADRRRADDHLSRVAGISRLQTRRLAAAGIPTLAALAASDRATVRGIGRPVLDTLRRQAALQARQYADGITRYELLDCEAGRGLALLPAPSPGDVFLDFEADPWVDDAGREYLLGALTLFEDGRPEYVAHWSHSAEKERDAFDRLMAFLVERRQRWPDMHVYHYGPYEESALKRLMGRHGIRDDDLDSLLRGDVLVDLYAVVRQAMRISEESYSIKRVERLYGMQREGPVTRPGFALVAYEEWLERQEGALLEAIEAYNRDDCVSVLRLREWLEERRAELDARQGPIPRPAPPDPPSEDLLAASGETADRERRLREGLPADRGQRTAAEQARWLLAALLDWHRRDARPEWWRHFFLRALPMEDLVAAPDALGGLEYEGVVDKVKRSEVHRYRYEPGQEHKFVAGKDAADWADGKVAGEVVGFDHAAGAIDLKRGVGSRRPHPRALIPAKHVPDVALRRAVARVADWVLENAIDGPGPYRAVRDLLLRRRPRLRGLAGADPLVRAGEDLVEAACRSALALDETCLSIQGPPGTGKTYTGARMALALVRQGRRVGITAQSHKAIGNFVTALLDAAGDDRPRPRVAQKGNDDQVVDAPGVDRMAGNDEVARVLAGSHLVAAGTPWLFASGEMQGAVDVLFVDEAGQMALANVVAMAGSARSIVLLGDPNQLPQVTQGSHPEGAGSSALEHVLDGRTTLPETEGLFLRDTRRLHPDLCAFTSGVFYEGRLVPHACTAGQRLLPGSRLGAGTGVVYVPAAHQGNAARSNEEAEVCASVVSELLDCRWVDERGVERPVRADDILIVAPYNAHVAEVAATVRARAGVDARVGTVDKFQGQEGAVVIYTMATSTAEEAPRTLDFLFSTNRLNVATSRARCVAVLLCSPDLLQAHCRRPEEMRMLNAFCRLVEMSGPTGPPRPPVQLSLFAVP